MTLLVTMVLRRSDPHDDGKTTRKRLVSQSALVFQLGVIIKGLLSVL